MVSQISIWITLVAIILWLGITYRYQADTITKSILNSIPDKRQNHWFTNIGQEKDTCPMMTKSVNMTDDSCASDVNKLDSVSLQTSEVDISDTVKDIEEYVAILEEQLLEVPKMRRKLKKPFRIVSGWARHPPPNPCRNSPCQNSGTCVNHGSYFTCNCTAGYTGTNCETNINECGSSPCVNGGICVDGVNRYTCNCVPGYTGTNCETDIDECASNPCVNNQTCIDLVNGYTCDCSDRYNGTHCEKDCRPGPADILFVIDSSSSGKNTLNSSISFIEKFLDTLPIGPDDFQIAAITFSNNATLEFDFNDYHDNTSLRNAFHSITNRGRATYTDVALSLARNVIYDSTLGARSNAKTYVILLYDGMSTERTTAISKRSNLLPNSNKLHVYAFGIGEQVDHIELQQIASKTEYVFSSKNNDAINRLLQETSHSDCDDCKENTKTDILILVDASSSNTITEFQHFLSVAGDLVRHLDVDNNTDIQLTVAGFAGGVQKNYPFRTFTSKNDLLSAVQKITPHTSHANAEEALRHAREVLFLPSNGGRNDARKMVALISNAKWISHNSVITEAEKLKKSDITLINIGVGIETDIDKFYDIASDPYHVFLILDGDTSILSSISSGTKYFTCAADIFSKRI